MSHIYPFIHSSIQNAWLVYTVMHVCFYIMLLQCRLTLVHTVHAYSLFNFFGRENVSEHRLYKGCLGAYLTYKENKFPRQGLSKTLCYRHTNCLTSLLRCTFSLAHDSSPRSTVTIHTPFSWQSFSTTLTKRA